MNTIDYEALAEWFQRSDHIDLRRRRPTKQTHEEKSSLQYETVVTDKKSNE